MKFLLDHDVPEDLSYLLETLGHQVTLLRKIAPADSSDEAVLQLASETESVLLTCNRDDFLALAGTKRHLGIIVHSPPDSDRVRCGPLSAVDARRGEWHSEQHQLRLTGLRDKICGTRCAGQITL